MSNRRGGLPSEPVSRKVEGCCVGLPASLVPRTNRLLARSPPRSLREREAVMSPSTAKAKVPQALKLTAALAATSGALHQTLLAVARAQGVNGAAWLDQLEAQFVRNTKNMTFTGCSMDAETGAVEAALSNLKTITTAVRAQIRVRRHNPARHRNEQRLALSLGRQS